MPSSEDDPRLVAYEELLDAFYLCGGTLRKEDADAFMKIWNDRTAPAPEVWKRALDKAENLKQP